MGLGFLTLGDSIDVVICPGCPTLSDWCSVDFMSVYLASIALF